MQNHQNIPHAAFIAPNATILGDRAGHETDAAYVEFAVLLGKTEFA